MQAQDVMRRLTALREQVQTWQGLEKKVADLLELAALASGEADEASLEAEIASEGEAVASLLSRLELKLLLSGRYDGRNALLTVHAGAGGTESQDWAEMLIRMYLRWAERGRYEVEVLDSSPGEETGVKSAVLSLRGDHAYGYLKSEHGVHRLVRISPFDSDHARHTSFALVEVLPEVEAEVDLEMKPEDLRIDVYRASGPGGQHMQKSSTAVRIVHNPTGLVATCQSERSQYQNKAIALRILYARLLERERKQKEEERARLKGKRIEAGWGNQIRSYVLHPYKMVKDHRTGYQTGDSAAVLDGELDEFISAYLKDRLGEEG